MRKQIRRNTFETNSSSCHSFTYGNTYNNLIVKEDGYVHTQLGEFGWEVEDYYDSATKLAYILLVAAHFTDNSFWCFVEDFEENLSSFTETELYKEIEDVIKREMECNGLIIDEGSEGYIDHQSLEQSSFEEWLKDTRAEDIEDFIFGDIVLHTDNDNY